MKNNKTLKKIFKKIEKKPAIFIAAIGLLFVVAGTFAYYYQEFTFPNRFKTMTYNVTLDEEFNDTWGTKKVTIKNEEENATPVVLRINYNEIWSSQESGNTIYHSNIVDGSNIVLKTWTNDFLNDFVLLDDGWYYYKKVLNSASSVQVLESIALDQDILSNHSEYEDYDYKMIFNYEAIQANESAISEIWNKQATISEGNVTWPS